MLSIRLVRRKIRSVANIKKITRAMEMVSAAKLRKVAGRLMAIRPYADKMTELLERLSGMAPVEAPSGDSATARYPLFEERSEVRRTALVAIASDKGLCGSYNANLLRSAAEFVAETPSEVEAVAVGRKANDYFSRSRVPLRLSLAGLPTEPGFQAIRPVVRQVVDDFLSHRTDQVFVLYTQYVNAVTFRCRRVRFLPVRPRRDPERAPVGPESKDPSESQEKKAARGAGVEPFYEPDPERILGALLPRYVEIAFYRMLLESLASEHAARMSAMHNATENAEELIEELTLDYNKARQASITKELLDIVGGAEALKG